MFECVYCLAFGGLVTLSEPLARLLNEQNGETLESWSRTQVCEMITCIVSTTNNWINYRLWKSFGSISKRKTCRIRTIRGRFYWILLWKIFFRQKSLLCLKWINTWKVRWRQISELKRKYSLIGGLKAVETVKFASMIYFSFFVRCFVQ